MFYFEIKFNLLIIHIIILVIPHFQGMILHLRKKMYLTTEENGTIKDSVAYVTFRCICDTSRERDKLTRHIDTLWST